jgi:hypothetical protein
VVHNSSQFNLNLTSGVLGPVADMAKEIPYEVVNSLQVRIIHRSYVPPVPVQLLTHNQEPNGQPRQRRLLERRSA